MFSKGKWVRIVAGSNYGTRTCFYEIVKGILVLRDAGESDNLMNNCEALEFEGLTFQKASEEIAIMNAEPVGHDDDGCHLCNFSIKIEEVEENDLPDGLIKQETPELMVSPLHLCGIGARELADSYLI